MTIRFTTLAASFAFAGSLATAVARGDATCPAMISSINGTLNAQGGYYNIEMTMHRSDVKLVSYSSGFVNSNNNTDWPLTGSSNQLFSDRLNGDQPFNINAADQLTFWISASGRLYIYYNTWNFTSDWDLSCYGSNLMSAVIPGFGVVTLTFRDWVIPIG
jgi:hypothetical protein